MNDLTYYLATFWGFYLIIGSLMLLFFPKVRSLVVSISKNDSTRLLLGVILGIAAILHISFHNLWISGPALIITLFGWLMLVKAVVLLIYRSLENLAEACFESKYTGFMYLFLICLGFFLVQSVNPILKF